MAAIERTIAMTALDTIKSLLWPNPTKAMSTKSTFTTGNYQGGGAWLKEADWSSISNQPRIIDAYRKCSTAYACVTLLADAVAESPLRVYQTVDGELEEQPDHRCRVLLANPNPYMSEAEFISLLVMTQGMFGYGLVEKVRSGAGLPVELWPLRPDWLRREPNGWMYRIPARDAQHIEDEDLIIVPYRHDERQQSLGISPLQIIAREVGVDVALTDLLKVFIDAGGIPPWVVELDGDMNFDQAAADTFREKWRQRYGGSQAYQNIGILNPGMKLTKVGDSIADMAWPDLRGLTEMKIAQAFRVPIDLIQARDSMNSGSLTTTEMTGAMAFLQNHGAQPLRMRIDGAFTRGLLVEFTGGDSTFSLEFDTSRILALQEDEDAKHERWRENWNAGLAMLNEARQAVGLHDLGNPGAVFKQQFTTILVPLNQLTSNGNGATEPVKMREIRPAVVLETGKTPLLDAIFNRMWAEDRKLNPPRVYRDHKAMSEIETKARANILQTTLRDRQKLTQIGERKLRQFFIAQGKRVVAAFPKSAGSMDVKADINWDHEDDLLRELMDKFYRSVGEKAFGTASATLDTVIAWDLANPNIANVLDLLGLRIVDISEQTRIDVVAKIAAGQAEGLNLVQIADSIESMFTETYANRAMTIARTETMHSYNLASQLSYQESDVVNQVEMVDNPDHDEDYGASDGLTCATRDGLVVDVSAMDSHVYAEHPNGSLAFIPILAKPLGEE